MDSVDLSGVGGQLVDSPTSAAAMSPLRSPASTTPQPSTPASATTPQHQPSTPQSSTPSSHFFASKLRPSKSLENDENEHYNPEEVYKSIRKTTAEIQNYSFEKSSLERDSTSQDSGISQLSHVSADKAAGKADAKLYPLEEMRQKTMSNTMAGVEQQQSSVVMSPMEQVSYRPCTHGLGSCSFVWAR